MSTFARPRRDSVGDSLATYLREIGSYPLIKVADEAQLARARRGDARAMDRLLCSNLRFVRGIARSPVSLDEPIGEDALLIEYLADDAASPDRKATGATLMESVEAALGELRAREATVVRLYFGCDGRDPMTLESIERRLGIP